MPPWRGVLVGSEKNRPHTLDPLLSGRRETVDTNQPGYGGLGNLLVFYCLRVHVRASSLKRRRRLLLILDNVDCIQNVSRIEYVSRSSEIA